MKYINSKNDTQIEQDNFKEIIDNKMKTFCYNCRKPDGSCGKCRKETDEQELEYSYFSKIYLDYSNEELKVIAEKLNHSYSFTTGTTTYTQLSPEFLTFRYAEPVEIPKMQDFKPINKIVKFFKKLFYGK